MRGDGAVNAPLQLPDVDVIAFDGDDTLWHSESVYNRVQDRFRETLRGYAPDRDIDASLLATEKRNMRTLGYGAKAFTISMLECAIEVTGGSISVSDLREILESGKAMLEHPVELIDGAAETVEKLARDHPLMLITKGDLHHQEAKVAVSGLASHFRAVEIVAEKDEQSYTRVLRRHGVHPSRLLMVGNSVRSDVLPVLRLGGRAVHVPYHTTWAHEVVESCDLDFPVIGSLRELPALIATGGLPAATV